MLRELSWAYDLLALGFGADESQDGIDQQYQGNGQHHCTQRGKSTALQRGRGGSVMIQKRRAEGSDEDNDDVGWHY